MFLFAVPAGALADIVDRRRYLIAVERDRGGLGAVRRARLTPARHTGVFEDVAERGRVLETFLVESWLEHLRQHERVTNADRVLEERIHGFLRDEPKVTHLIAAGAARDPAEQIKE